MRATGLEPGDKVVGVVAKRTQAPRPDASRGSKSGGTLRLLLGLGAVIGVVVFVVNMNSSGSGLSSSQHDTSFGAPEGPRPLLSPSPQVIVDEEVAVGADGWQARSFMLPSARPIQVSAVGRSHADKGFSVYVMNSAELDHFRNRETFQHIPALEGLKTRSFKNTATLTQGSWTVVVFNSENIMNTMVVHLRVVANP